MYECDICYNLYKNINFLPCCKGKRMCIKCKSKCGNNKCPFCRQNMKTKPAVIIINKNFPYPKHGEILFSSMNYNVVKIW